MFQHIEFIIFALVDLAVFVVLIRFFSKKGPKSNPNTSNDEDDGVSWPEDPVLDLPPGVSPPVNEPELVV